MYLNKWINNLALLVCATGACSVAMAQVELGARSAAGAPGQTVEVEIYYIGDGAARTYQFDVTTDLTQIEGGESGVDVSRCIESAPPQPIENCVPQNPPNEATVRIGQASFTDPMPDIDPIGVILYTISVAATPGTAIPLDITDFAVENVDPADVTAVSAEIAVLDVTAILNVQPPALNFGNQQTGSTSAPQPVTISNDGSDGVDLAVSSIAITGDFGPDSGGSCPAVPFDLADGESCTQHVQFSPAVDGPASGSLTVVSDAGEVDNDTVALSGEGTPPPDELSVVQSPLYGVVGGPIIWNVLVHVLDTNGDLFVDDSSTVVELDLATDPTGTATLSGATAVTVTNGVAVFSDLSIDRLGSGFVIGASDQSGTLDPGQSDPFNVVPDELLQDRFEE